MTSTGINWVAYQVVKENYCEPDEIIGYYQTNTKAQGVASAERAKYRSGICCDNKDLVRVNEIIIEN